MSVVHEEVQLDHREVSKKGKKGAVKQEQQEGAV